MFDDPRKELERMQQALWDAEEEPQESIWEGEQAPDPDEEARQWLADLLEEVELRPQTVQRPGNSSTAPRRQRLAAEFENLETDSQKDTASRASLKLRKKGAGLWWLVLLAELGALAYLGRLWMTWLR